MRVSYDWLKTMIDIPEDPKTLSDEYIRTGTEVEAIDTVGESFDHVVTAKVLTKTPHPDSDHMYVCSVDVGDKNLDADGNPAPLQIVCGAQNFEAGDHIVTAMIGAVLPGDVKIKKSKLRGVVSMGMNCSARELGLGGDHSGIMILPEDTPCGMPFAEYVGSSDTVLDCEITPNRPDCLSMIGMARETGAIFDRDFHVELPAIKAETGRATDDELSVEIADEGLCDRYVARIVRNVKVGPSPDWMVKRLNALGVRPHNNIVDITNFILHEVGQPLHAFDAGKIKGGKVIVRTCPEGTPFVTLDGVERKLSDKDLMICDTEKPMCIAGVFGGLDSGVTETTTDVFIESAYFNPVWIRKSAKRHGLSTDASFRFERGIDPEIAPYALKRAALLMVELAGGKVSSPVTDLYPVPVRPFRFDISLSRVKRLMGKDVPDETIRRIILALDIKIEKEDGDTLGVAVPPYRVDVQREADLVEDILRIYGYNNIEIPQQVHSTLSYAPNPDRDKVTNVVADLLTANDFNEIMSNSLTKAAYYEGLEAYKAENSVAILNPLSNDLNVMRQTLLFNALEAVELNTNRKNGDLKLYEFGNCYSYDRDKASEGGLAPYSEQNRLSILITGADHVPSWNVSSQPTSFYTLKTVAEKIFARIGIDLNGAMMETLSSDLYREAVTYKINGKRMVEMGIVSKKIRSMFDIKAEVYYLEMNFDAFLKLTRNHKVTVQELSKFPEVRRDLALLVDSQTTFSQLREIAFATEKKLLKNVTLFDVYEGDKLPAGKKSYALNFVLEDTTKTLVDQVIDKTMANLVREFERRAGAQVRS